MLSDKMQDALNAQINMEFSAYYTYLSMSAYFQGESLTGFAGWMYHHAQEEMMHAMKIYNFVNERRGKIKLQALPGPTVEWPTIISVFEDALKHEQKVTASINKLVDLAISESDHATRSFLNWFVDEQVEEEAIVDAMIQDLKRVGDFGPGIFMLDRGLAGNPSEAEGGDAT